MFTSLILTGAFLTTALYITARRPRPWILIFETTATATKWSLVCVDAVVECASNALTFSRNTTTEKPRLVIVGASFAGLCALRELYRDFQVTLVDFKNYFEFVPGVLRAYVDPEHLETITCPLPTNIQYDFVHAFVESVTSNAVVGHCPERDDEVVIPFDYLLLACGSSYQGAVKATSAEPTISDRRRTFANEHRRLDSAQSVLIIGGGPVGVELAAEIVSTFPDKILTIVDRSASLCASFPKKSIDYMTSWLTARNVRLELGVAIAGHYPRLEIDQTGCTLSNDRRINADIVYICTGFQRNTQLMRQEFGSHLHPQGDAVIVNDYLQLEEYPNIYAVGDVMRHSSNEVKLAYTAELNALVASENILRSAQGQESVKYPERLTGNSTTPIIYALSLGRYDGTLVFNDLVINGGLAAYVKWFVEWTKTRACGGSIVNQTIWRIGDKLSVMLGRSLLRRRVYAPGREPLLNV